jgi:hypothetical protein
MGAAECACVVAARQRFTNTNANTVANGNSNANTVANGNSNSNTVANARRDGWMFSHVGGKPGICCR